MSIDRLHLVRVAFLVIVSAAACGRARPGAGSGGTVRAQRNIDALQRLERTPVACSADGDCPTGSHCDDATHRCGFGCLADSDCGDGQACDAGGSCTRAGVHLFSAVTTAGCSAIPVPNRLAALAALTDDPAVCFGDEDCPCGAYCANDATCHYDCLVDNQSSPPFCNAGLTCSAEGRCIQPDHSNDPTYIVDLQLAPDLLKANTAAGAVVVPAAVRIRAKQASFVSGVGNTKVTVSFAEASPTAASVPAHMPRVRCAPAAALAASCDLVGGWIMGTPADALLSQPRQVWVELPQDVNAESWTLTARSEWSDTVASVPVLAQPVVTEPHQTGHFAGTLSWPQAGGDPLVLPIDAYVTPTRVAIVDPSRVLLPDAPAVLSRDATQTTLVTWLWTEANSPLATINLDLDTFSFDAAKERITAGVHLSAFNGPQPALLTLDVTYAGPPTASCGGNTWCAQGSYCEVAIGLCLPGKGSLSWIQSDGAAPPQLSPNPSALQKTWLPAVDTMRSQNMATLGGDDIIGLEHAACFNDPTQAFAGRLGSANGTASRDVLCEDGTPQQVFPYADLTSALTVNAQGTQTFSLLESCVADLNVSPTAPFTPAHLLVKKQCVSLARFLLARRTSSPGNTNYPQVARRRLENQLMREWLTLHALIARTATQEREYDEIAGLDDQPAADRLGGYVDLIDRDWRLALHGKRTPDADRVAAQRPDYRTLARPAAYWTFNQHLDGAVGDDENGIPMHFNNLAGPDDHQLVLQRTGTNIHGHVFNGASCYTDADVALPSRHFSLVAWIGAGGTKNDYVLFQKNGSDGDWFRIKLYDYSTTQRWIEIADSRGGMVTFTVTADIGYWAFVEDGGVFKIYSFVRDSNNVLRETDYLPTNKLGPGPEWGSPGRVSLGCNPSSGVVILDDISLWEKPLAPDAVMSFAARHVNDPLVRTIPPSSLALDAKDEQANGLAVHLVDAAAAQMSLLSAYVHAEEAALFNECGNPNGAAHTRVLGRVGRGLRLAQLLENDAADLVALAGTTAQPWLPRYTATQKLLAGKRADVVHRLDVGARCLNPLGVSESDVPLFHGEAVGASDRFFASTHWLTQQAHTQIDQAKSELELARGAWQQARVSEFQNHVLAPAETAARVAQIESAYESQIRRYCGAPATGTLMTGIRNGTITTTNCFIKLENSACAGMDHVPPSSVPAACLRGEIGEQILAVQTAYFEERTAEGAYNRSIAQYDSDMEYCTRRDDYNQETEALQQAHREYMTQLREQRRSDSVLGSFIKDAAFITIGGLAGQPQLAMAGFTDFAGVTMSQAEKDDSEAEQDAESEFQLVLSARAHVLDNMDCFHKADDEKFAIDAAHDVIKRTYQSTKSALLHLANLHDEVSALTKQAAGDIEVEQNLPRVLPHHHFWLSDHIDAYRRHFRYAQRLTYLALRAFEYESQQSIGYRNDILTARTLAILDQVTTALDQRTAPMQGESGFVIGSFAPVMSLRDEIVRFASGNAPPGFPATDATSAFRNYLKSDAAKIYAGDQYLGRGIRFSMAPPAWAQFSCAERIWRVTTALQVQGSPINNARMVLWQENSFGSQTCHASDAGKLHVATVRPNHNLLIDDSGNFDRTPFQTPLRYTAMEVEGLGNKTRDDLAALPEGRHAGFAGRGLYGNYVLLFPSQQFDQTFLDNVKDVLFRFDLVEATNVSGDPNL